MANADLWVERGDFDVAAFADGFGGEEGEEAVAECGDWGGGVFEPGDEVFHFSECAVAFFAHDFGGGMFLNVFFEDELVVVVDADGAVPGVGVDAVLLSVDFVGFFECA